MKIKHINKKTLSICIFVTECLLLAGLFAATFFLSASRRELAVSTNNYIHLDEQADMVKEASDYLTEQARLFVMTTDVRYAEQYFVEANVTRRRENALAALQSHNWADIWEAPISQAIEYSDALMEQELYAMKLAAEAQGYPASVLPSELQEIQPEPADAALEPAAMIEKAQTMVFNTQYQHTKNTIYDKLFVYTQGILLEAEDDIEVAVDNLTRTTAVMRVLVGALAALVVLGGVVRRAH